MNRAAIALPLLLALVSAGAGCTRGLAATLPGGPAPTIAPLAPGQVPPVTLPAETPSAGSAAAGPFLVHAADAYVQHWIGDQWMLHVTVTLVNRSMQPQTVDANTLDVVADFPSAVPMIALQSTTMLPRQALVADVVWAVPFGGALPRTLGVTTVASAVATAQRTQVPVVFALRRGEAAQIRAAPAGAPGQSATAVPPGAVGASASDPSAAPVGFFQLLREQLRSVPCAITLGAASGTLWYSGHTAVRVGLVVENTSRAPLEVRRSDFLAAAGGVVLTPLPHSVTFPDAVTLAPGERAMGTLGWLASASGPHEIHVAYGEPDSRGRRPFQQTVAFTGP